jgi:hypothetical protein
MLSKESKIKVLENFYGVDYVFFGKTVKEQASCCPVVKEEYLSIKGAMLSVYIEMLKLMEYSPASLKEKVSTASLMKNARENAKAARFAAQKVVTTEAARADIKAELKESLHENKDQDIPALVENKIREKAFRLAVDNMLVARALTEATNLEAMNEWSGKIIEDSYKILRDSLCETAMLILDDDELE